MPKKPKGKNALESEPKKTPVESPLKGEKDSWSRDQREKDYYYDDSYGYEIYDPEAEDEEAEEDDN